MLITDLRILDISHLIFPINQDILLWSPFSKHGNRGCWNVGTSVGSCSQDPSCISDLSSMVRQARKFWYPKHFERLQFWTKCKELSRLTIGSIIAVNFVDMHWEMLGYFTERHWTFSMGLQLPPFLHFSLLSVSSSATGVPQRVPGYEVCKWTKTKATLTSPASPSPVLQFLGPEKTHPELLCSPYSP